MANCIQNFKSVINSRQFKNSFGGIFSTEAFLNENLDSEVWNQKQNELVNLILNANNDTTQAFDFKVLESKLQDSIQAQYDKMDEFNPWKAIENVDKIHDFISEILNDVKGNLIQENNISTNPEITLENGNKERLFDFSKLSNLTFELDSFENYLKTQINSGLFKSIFISIFNNESSKYKYEKFVVTDAQLNKNIAFFKNELWDDIVDYYIGYHKRNNLKTGWSLADTSLYNIKQSLDGDAGIDINSNLFDIQKNGKSFYSEVISFVKNQMDNAANSGEDLKIFNNGRITLSQAYIKSLVLSNFDSFLLKHHHDKVKVNEDSANSFGKPTNGEFKYKLELKWVNKKSFGDETSSNIEHQSTSLIKMISYVIPFYEEVKLRSGRSEWKPNIFDQTVGKSNIDAIGAIVNSIDPNLLISHNGVNTSIGELFLKYDSGEITFKEILNLLTNEVASKSNEVNNKLSVLVSIREFLYGRNGLSSAIYEWRQENPLLADNIINPEIALINHLRTSVKNIYSTTSTNEISGAKTRSIDVLNIDSLVKYDFDKLANNLVKNWKVNKILKTDNINSFDDLIKFLNDPNKGGMDISQKTQSIFLKENPEFADSSYFQKNEIKENLIKLLSHPKLFVDGKFRPYTIDEVSDYIKSSETNSAIKLFELFKASHKESKHNIISQIKNYDGASMPTMGISNLATLFGIAVNKTENFFKQNPGFYKRTEIILDVVGKNSGKSAQDLTANELFKLHFTRGFIESMITNSEISVQPWDYSDKPKIYAVVVDANKQLNSSFGNMSLKQMNSGNMLDAFYKAQGEYYIKLLNNIYSDFLKFDPDHFKGVTNYEEKIERIENFFEKLNEKSKPAKHLAELINKHFNEGKEYIEITQDLHYSNYEGKLKFNQFLKGNIQAFTNKSVFNKWVSNKENAFIKQMGASYIPFNQLLVGAGIDANSQKIEKIEEIFGKQEYETNEHGSPIGLKLYNNGNLTEIAKRFLWSKNLVTSQYANTTVKDVFLHPAKGVKFEAIDLKNDFDNGINKYIEEEDKRAIAFTKRMNVPGASISIYGKGKEGINLSMKIAAMTDPGGEVFNYIGDSQGQDVFDGGTIMNPFMNELIKGSMPGNNLQSSQKPLAESITEKTSTTLKFATFAISNEEIRNSEFSPRSGFTMMKKMNNFDMWEDNNHVNLFEIKSELGTSDINIQDMLPGFAIPHEGKYKLLGKIDHLEKSKYKINFLDGTSKNVELTTLFDIWEAFGGAYSATLENGVPKHNEYSIDLVVSLIKKHSIFSPELKLKDKMIGMLLPASAIKKGVTNINTDSSVYTNDDKKLSYFNFDTSFFGVQLDPFHATSDAETNEITQVMSAITEMNSTPELSNLVYDGVASMIDKGLKKFNKIINDKEKYNALIKTFVDHLNNSAQINNARGIINGISDDLEGIIPLDDKTMYKQFVSFVVAKINSDFIRRVFPGSSSVLRPSHGFIMIFESNSGKKYLTENLLNEYEKLKKSNPEFKAKAIAEITANNFKSERDLIKSKIQLFLNYSNDFKPKPLEISEIRPLDTVEVKIGEETKVYNLTEINSYFELKKQLKELPEGTYSINKLFTQPRDLKPEDPTFIQLVSKTSIDPETGEPIVISKSVERSLFDLEAVEFKYQITNSKLEDLQLDKKYNDFINYIKSINLNARNEEDPKTLYKYASHYAQLWVRRSFELAAINKLFAEYKDFESEENPFSKIFSYSNGTLNDDFTSRLDWDYDTSTPLQGYKHRRPENIHTNVFKNNFGIGETALSDVSKENFALGNNRPNIKSLAFDLTLYNSVNKNQLNIVLEGQNLLTVDGKLYERYALEKESLDKKISISEATQYVQPIALKATNIFTKTDDSNETYRISSYGSKMYKLPENWEIYKDSKGRELLVINDPLNDTINKFQSGVNDNKISEIVKADFEKFMKSYNDYDSVYFKETGYDSIAKLTSKDDEFLNFMNSVESVIGDPELSKYVRKKIKAYELFKSSVMPEEGKVVDKNDVRDKYNAFKNSLEWKQLNLDYLNKLSKTRMRSFEKSIQSISARIPAQGMQSFMSMDTVAFKSGHANDVYVSHWQLWLQGSDSN